MGNQPIAEGDDMVRESAYWPIERRMKYLVVPNAEPPVFRSGDVATLLEEWADKFMRDNEDLEMKPSSGFIAYWPPEEGERSGEIRIKFWVRLR